MGSFCSSSKTCAYRQDQLPSTHPVAADIVDLEAIEYNFDQITYAKGAAVLVQLVAYVGRDAFLRGIRSYFAEHAYGNTSLARPAAQPRAGLRPRSVRLVARNGWRPPEPNTLRLATSPSTTED